MPREQLIVDPGIGFAKDAAHSLAALAGDYQKLLIPHAAEHGEIFNRVTLDLGGDHQALFAVGLDRLVAILAGEENIREVIAFPKTQSGADPMTNSPLEVDPKQLADLGLKVLPKID